MMARRRAPIGVVLAGGLGRRIGGSKAVVKLGGKPLIAYPLEALTIALDDVAVIAKPDTELPSMPGISVWLEPQAPRHPLIGITHALGYASGRSVLVCAGDLPFVTPELIDRLAHASLARAPAIVAAREGAIQPLLGRYEPRAGEMLRAAAVAADQPVVAAVSAIGARRLEVEDPEELFNINAPDDLLQAAAMLDRRRRLRAGANRM
jgi:molybdenum cofactor guanylyltransferase